MAASNHAAPWFHGRISRTDAEEILSATEKEGAFLIRQNMFQNGVYALSLLHKKGICHYLIRMHPPPNNYLSIESDDNRENPKFLEMSDLIKHYMETEDGLLSKLKHPCKCKHDLVLELKQAAISNTEVVETQESNKSMVDLSSEQWYHGRISRTDAEKILDGCGAIDGSYLVRDSLSTTGEYVLSLCYQSNKYHYIISRHLDGSLAIQDGTKFDNPVDLVNYHSQKIDGLFTTLRHPCRRMQGHPPKGYRFISHAEMQQAMREGALLLGYQEHQIKDALLKRRSAFEQLVGGILHRRQGWFHGAIDRQESERRICHFNMSDGLFLVRERTQVNSFALCVAHNAQVYHYLLDMNSLGQLSIENGKKFENLLQVVDHYSRTPDGLLCCLGDFCPVSAFENLQNGRTQHLVRHGPLRIDDNELELLEDLGAGTFGTVKKGIYRPKSGEKAVECALKCLKPTEELPNQKAEILREADAMANLDHPNIVRLFGICVGNPIRLVMEIAKLGPLNKFLRKNQDFPVKKITTMVLQVAKGMEYLEKVRFVHRDLAARNVLVVDHDNVKISDFGMSRAIGVGSDYYKAETAGRWPLKWYAPECIYYAKFDSKSDVWSYGVTAWEAFSYGSKPYQGMRGVDIMQMLEGNERLDSPEKCPPAIYEIMLRCWSWRAEDRPSFTELVVLVSDAINRSDHVTTPPVRPPRPGFSPLQQQPPGPPPRTYHSSRPPR